MKNRIIPGLVFTLSIIFPVIALAMADLASDINSLQRRWAEVNYQLQGKTRLSAFKMLISKADTMTAKYPDAAPVWIWSGIIKSTYAGAAGGFGALKYAKAAKQDLEKALAIEPDAMQGSAYTTLGSLYYNVPGWPIGFGDDTKAEELLRKAVAIDPNGIDSNYFYGDFLLNQDRYPEAEQYLLKARSAPPRPSRPVADAGRQREITQALLRVREKLDK